MMVANNISNVRFFPRFLTSKLIARERKYCEAEAVVLGVELLQLDVVHRGHASFACDIDDHTDLSLEVLDKK